MTGSKVTSLAGHPNEPGYECQAGAPGRVPEGPFRPFGSIDSAPHAATSTTTRRGQAPNLPEIASTDGASRDRINRRHVRDGINDRWQKVPPGRSMFRGASTEAGSCLRDDRNRPLSGIGQVGPRRQDRSRPPRARGAGSVSAAQATPKGAVRRRVGPFGRRRRVQRPVRARVHPRHALADGHGAGGHDR
jgi:hypothetical protein